jgi:RNA polymerase sigma-70 factor (ECF subfamily)
MAGATALPQETEGPEMSWARALASCADVRERDRVGRGDEITAGELHARYLKDLFHYVFRRVPRREEAADITAEVFAAAFAGLPRFRGHCPPYLWLLSIARKQIALAQRRRAARHETLASELADESGAAASIWEALAVSESPEVALTQAEGRRVIRELITELNADQREALLLQYWERLSITEIATVMGRSPASVNSLLQRARRALYERGQAYFLGDDEGRSDD